jgi:hypothetical protein
MSGRPIAMNPADEIRALSAADRAAATSALACPFGRLSVLPQGRKSSKCRLGTVPAGRNPAGLRRPDPIGLFPSLAVEGRYSTRYNPKFAISPKPPRSRLAATGCLQPD